MFRLLKIWLRDKFFSDTDDIRYFQVERVLAGRSAEERLQFWRELLVWLGTDQGKAFMAIQQGEYVRIQQELLSNKAPELQAGLLAAFRQQNYVISFQAQVEGRIALLAKKVKAQDTPGR